MFQSIDAVGRHASGWKALVVFLAVICEGAALSGADSSGGSLVLKRISAENGRENWAFRIPQALAAYRVEVFPDAVILSLRAARGESTEVFALRPEDGSPRGGIDSRRFHAAGDDPLLGVSGHEEYQPFDQRTEVVLANGWHSSGMGRVRWGMGRVVHFFKPPEWNVVWTLTIPERVADIKSWKDMILYRVSKLDGRVRLGELHGVAAGETRDRWTFMLPTETAPEKLYGSDIVGLEGARDIDFHAGEELLWVVGAGVLFALDPRTGSVQWRREVRDADNATLAMAGVRVLPRDQGVLVYSRRRNLRNTVARFDDATAAPVILARDYFHAVPPTVVGDALYYIAHAEP